MLEQKKGEEEGWREGKLLDVDIEDESEVLAEYRGGNTEC